MPLEFAEVILPIPIEKAFTYSIPHDLASMVNIGHRVIVPFGRRKFLTGVVRSFATKAPEGFEIKEIATVLDNHPIVRYPQMNLWEWVADYYMCSIGEVYKAALPSGLKIESETFIEANPDYEFDELGIDDERECLIYQLLNHEGHLTIDEIENKSGLKRVAQTINSMLEKGIVIISEKIIERYRAIKESYVRPLFTHDEINQAFTIVKSARKQETLLMALIELSGINRRSETPKEVKKDALLERAGVTAPILNAIVKKGLVEIYKKEINRFKFDGAPTGQLPVLTDEQRRALDEITSSWQDKQTVLLHGITSSGKTEIYSHLIDVTLKKGDQVLYLVPEIALTTQLTQRLQKIFGNNVVVYHSKFSDNERVDIWKSMLENNKPMVILGARSSLFLPFSKLGLVIVDEEHEPSYKQADPAPRYNARDVALVLASMHGAKALLGTATPSIETYYKALNGKFGLVKLMNRYGNLPLPPVKIVDMAKASKKRETNGALSINTIKSINLATEAGKQVILFRNRRGYAPLARCKQCAWIPKCKNCDVSLTYHNYSRQLVCHYCGATYPLPDLCPQCGLPSVEVLGYGTERIENEIESIFPTRKVIRMDLDTTRNKDGYERLIDEFSQKKADILVGTQMVTKGLNFKDVQVVAILNADELIHIPEFKASERAFNMLEQVSGRAGRADSDNSEVIVQTWTPDHPIFNHLINHDYEGFYMSQILERKQFAYPPFTHIIYIYLKHRDSRVLQTFSNTYANRLRQLLGTRVSGPDQPKVARVKSLYIQKIMVKIEANASIKKLRELLRNVYKEMATDPAMKTSTVYYDVDP